MQAEKPWEWFGGLLLQNTAQSCRKPLSRFPEFASTHTKEGVMLWAIFVILLILWLLGFTLHVAGSLIHLLLVVALIVLVINLVSGRRSAI
jgi:hypothetical protein